MKKDNNKKTRETNIGKIIYSFLLFMPLIAIGVTCLYAIFNKNAYQSYRTTTDTIESITTVDNQTLIAEHNTYYIDNKVFQQETAGEYNYGYNFIIENPSYDLKQVFNYTGSADIIGIYYRSYNTFTIFGCRLNDNTFLNFQTANINNLTELQKKYINDKIQFTFIEYGQAIPNQTISINYNLTCFNLITYNTPLLNDTFYYSIDRVEQSNLFNWSKDSIVYNTLETTCNQLNITNTFIPMLLAYWLIISVIYFLYDIALLLIWSTHDKIHELRNSL